MKRARTGWRASRTWRNVRIVWATAGISLFLYLILSYSARGVGDDVLTSGDDVVVSDSGDVITFSPRVQGSGAALLFMPGGMVDPHAYAPLLRRVAEAGHTAVLVRLPSLGGRHARGAEGRREAVQRGVAAMAAAPAERRWVVAGHSLGGVLAAMIARAEPPSMAALALLGTTHPRDFSLAALDVPVMKVYGTRDGIARYEAMRANAANLPEATDWVAIEGGNHSQFGYYGFQLRDGRARISREEQQDQVLAALLRLLDGAAAR
ncbi:MAG TPA: alpha/beta family hydrolase [Longimicrobiales bacterium]|nr:alpha/beta family hydrolase [Longimicrobiales bacterium]